LPPISGGRDKDYWTPKNYDGSSGDTLTLRRALENSRNLATVHLLDGGIESKPQASLDRLCDLALEAQIYHECVRYYPFVLGAQPVRPVDLAAFYAAIANEGLRPVPYVVDSIERDGEPIYSHEPASVAITSVDHAAFYQLKSMMQGVLARGTARSIAHLAPYVAGKTGTSDDENDAWFVGFSNEATVAVWLGYDNADGKRRTLGGGATGGGVAVPIFEPVMQAVWAHVAPKTALAPPSPEAKLRLSCKSVDRESGEVQRSGGISECFRTDAKGKIIDTQYRLISGAHASVRRDRDDDDERPRRVRREPRSERTVVRRTYARPQWGWGGGWGWGWGWQ
jgi:penicillin-binding protein 1A